MINEAVKEIKVFQKKAGQYLSDSPKLIPRSIVSRRAKWIEEELKEFTDASNIYEQADAITDLLYYVLGAYAEIGIDPDPLFEIVHNANMRKVNDPDRKNIDRDGKILKPKGWVHPDTEIKNYIDNIR